MWPKQLRQGFIDCGFEFINGRHGRFEMMLAMSSKPAFLSIHFQTCGPLLKSKADTLLYSFDEYGFTRPIL